MRNITKVSMELGESESCNNPSDIPESDEDYVRPPAGQSATKDHLNLPPA